MRPIRKQPHADAVYFNNLEEALAELLSNALHAASAAVWAKPEWFSASLLGVEAGTSFSRQIPAIVERLRPPALAVGAGAAILFAALGDADPAALLAAIPTGTIREWMREMEGQKHAGNDAPAMQLPLKLKTAVERAAAQFGWKNPGVVWLAVQAVLCVSPSTWIAGTAVKRARATLRMLEAERGLNVPDRNASTSSDTHPRALVFDDDEETAAAHMPAFKTEPGPSPEKWAENPARPDETNLEDVYLGTNKLPLIEETVPALSEITDAPLKALVFDDGVETATEHMPAFKTEPGSSPEKRAENPAMQGDTNPRNVYSETNRTPLTEPVPSISDEAPKAFPPSILPADGPAPVPLLGSTTSGAGLFFLLNGLRRAGIVRALDACPALAEAHLVMHILKRLATHAGVPGGDSILLCLRSQQEQFTLDSKLLAGLTGQLEAWPLGFAASSRATFDSEYFLRVWVLAVKRWCWRAGRMTVAEIVQRKGRVWQTRTDIDVTLPLTGVDIRIRRIGLDIDPGWLPWFGEHGRVVRFHYSDREPGVEAC